MFEKDKLLFSLLLLLNVNMGAFDVSASGDLPYDEETDEHPSFIAYAMLHEVSTVHQLMDADGQRRR